jgi:hypothetical protein
VKVVEQTSENLKQALDNALTNVALSEDKKAAA